MAATTPGYRRIPFPCAERGQNERLYSMKTNKARPAKNKKAANKVLEPDLNEFTMHLGADGRLLMAAQLERWVSQLRISAAILDPSLGQPAELSLVGMQN
jgi:hypothetical protein